MCDQIQIKMYDTLKRAYPKAMRECELYEAALNGIPAMQHLDKKGGSYMRKMVQWGCARKIAEGYYVCSVPFKPLQAPTKLANAA
jgi:hypothetical protein